MTDYTEAINELSDALMAATPDSSEWIKAKAALNALDDAQFAESQASFVNASRGIGDATAKLQAIIAGTKPDPASQFLDHITAAFKELTLIATNVDALLAGEPATPLPGMAVTNQASFPSPDEAIVPPLKQKAGAPTGAAQDEQRGVDLMIDDILQREGGFVNHPNDRGGPTNFGITMRTLAAWRSPSRVDVPEVRNLRIDEARKIYRSNYFAHPKIDQLPALIQPVMFDMSINHGPAAAIKLLQQVLNDKGRACDIDGGIGEETLQSAEAACKALGKDLVNALVTKRIALFQQIVAGDESQRVFLAGWLNRANEFSVA
jgi:hypothetical protein